VIALASLVAAALLTAVTNPYALVFLLPSLYAWVWIPQLRDRPGWMTDTLLGLGFAGPVLVLVVLAQQLDLGLRSGLYAVALATSGTTPWGLVAAFLVWLAAATQIVGVAGRFAQDPIG
jgi:hypothetical protein